MSFFLRAKLQSWLSLVAGPGPSEDEDSGVCMELLAQESTIRLQSRTGTGRLEFTFDLIDSSEYTTDLPIESLASLVISSGINASLWFYGEYQACEERRLATLARLLACISSSSSSSSPCTSISFSMFELLGDSKIKDLNNGGSEESDLQVRGGLVRGLKSLSCYSGEEAFALIKINLAKRIRLVEQQQQQQQEDEVDGEAMAIIGNASHVFISLVIDTGEAKSCLELVLFASTDISRVIDFASTRVFPISTGTQKVSRKSSSSSSSSTFDSAQSAALLQAQVAATVQSLATLTRVTRALRDAERATKSVVHVPYRDSLLTRLLQPTLTGNFALHMLTSVKVKASDSLSSTLRFAAELGGLYNHVVLDRLKQGSTVKKTTIEAATTTTETAAAAAAEEEEEWPHEESIEDSENVARNKAYFAQQLLMSQEFSSSTKALQEEMAALSSLYSRLNALEQERLKSLMALGMKPVSRPPAALTKSQKVVRESEEADAIRSVPSILALADMKISQEDLNKIAVAYTRHVVDKEKENADWVSEAAKVLKKREGVARGGSEERGVEPAFPPQTTSSTTTTFPSSYSVRSSSSSSSSTSFFSFSSSSSSSTTTPPPITLPAATTSSPTKLSQESVPELHIQAPSPTSQKRFSRPPTPHTNSPRSPRLNNDEAAFQTKDNNMNNSSDSDSSCSSNNNSSHHFEGALTLPPLSSLPRASPPKALTTDGREEERGTFPPASPRLEPSTSTVSTPISSPTASRKYGSFSSRLTDNQTSPWCRDINDKALNSLAPQEREFLWSVANERRADVEALLNKGVSISTKSGFGRDAMQIAARNGSIGMLEYLANEWGGDLSTRGPRGDTLFILAASNGHLGCLKWLHARGALPDAVDMCGQSAVHHAARRGEYKLLEWFFSLGLELDVEDFEDQTPLALVPRNGPDEESLTLTRSFLDSVYAKKGLQVVQDDHNKRVLTSKNLVSKKRILERFGRSDGDEYVGGEEDDEDGEETKEGTPLVEAKDLVDGIERRWGV